MLISSRSRQINNNNREIYVSENSKFPQLHRLCSDFGFAVIGMCESTATPKKYVLCEIDLISCGLAPESVSPEFQSLKELESFAVENVVDIVQKYLFGERQFLEAQYASIA